MGQALYRKHRPKSLKEVVGQEHVTRTLEQALKQGRISHAYLFSGPRGVGKTSIARILAHEINGLPYEDDSAHMDIIEIDAASNRRIDEIRELRDKIYVAPTSVKYKVYIIDEVHMLTKEAFNALLKTLEEPPEHAVFILATTDAHKLPDTIVSRTQRFTFQPVTTEKVAAHLSDIAKKEKIKVAPDALELLAQHGEGSFRDSISLLDQLSGRGGPISTDDVEMMLGVPSDEAVGQLLRSLDQGRPQTTVSVLEGLFRSGFQPSAIAKRLGRLLREQLVEGGTTLPADQTLDLLGKLIKVPASHDPERFLEITLLGVSPSATALPAKSDMTPDIPADESVSPEPEAQPKPVPRKEPYKAEDPSAKPDSKRPFDESIWPHILEALKKNSHSTLYGVVRMGQPSFLDEGTLRLAFAFQLHEKRIKEANNRKKLSDVLYELTGERINVEAVLDETAKPVKVTLEAPDKPDSGRGSDLNAISNIFGTAELLES